jgi:hypothetical protein
VNDASTAARAPSLWLDPPPDSGTPLEGELEADNPELLGRRRLRMPPEPLRWAGARIILAALGLLDRRNDRRARPRPT